MAPEAISCDADSLALALRQRDERLAVLGDAAAHLLSTDDPDAMVRGLFERVKDHFQIDTYFNFMVNEAGDALTLASCAGIPDETARSISRLEFGQAICGAVAQCRRPIVATSIQQCAEPRIQLVRGFGIRVYACNPLMAGDRLLGTLSFASRSRDCFAEDELEFFRTICHYVELAIERTRMERQLRESQKLESVGLLAAGVAHDFNNLLAAIVGHTSLAAEIVADAEVRTMLQRVLDAGDRAADLTRQLLAYSGKGPSLMRAVDVSGLVRDTAALIQVTLPKKVQLELDLAAGLPPVTGDPSQLRQIVMNLIINAAESIGDRVGSVRVSTAAAGGQRICLAVADNGCGMDAATRARIFDPFFTTKVNGRGLGLAAVSGIVRAHHGELMVASAPGRGSTFHVLFPAAAAQTHEAAHPADSTRSLRGSGTILVVDDEEVVRLLAKAVLERYGYDVVLAGNGRDAIRAVEQDQSIALVLLDLAMPVLGGDEAVTILKDRRPTLRIVMTSGYSEAEGHRRFGNRGVNGFIQKPYTATQLAGKVKSVLLASPDVTSAVA